MVTHPDSDRTQPCLTSVKLMVAGWAACYLVIPSYKAALIAFLYTQNEKLISLTLPENFECNVIFVLGATLNSQVLQETCLKI